MMIAGNTPILVNGKVTRICGRVFNHAVRKNPDLLVQDPTTGNAIIPSKGFTWLGCAVQIRAGVKVLASVRPIKKS